MRHTWSSQLHGLAPARKQPYQHCTVPKEGSLLHLCSRCIWCQGKKKKKCRHSSFRTKMKGSAFRKAFTKSSKLTLAFCQPARGYGVQMYWSSRDVSKVIDFLSASAFCMSGAGLLQLLGNSLSKFGSWQYKHPRGPLLTGLSPHILGCWLFRAALVWLICLRKTKQWSLTQSPL